MTLQESLKSWIDNNLLSVSFLHENLTEIEGVGKFLVVEPKTLVFAEGSKAENVIFDGDFQINLSDKENVLADQADYLLFQFGDRWYYCSDLVPDEIKEFKYLGKPTLTFDRPFPYLGIHGGFELCNGSRSYEDWIKKAKFLGITTLGIAEENTLAGTLAFQDACKSAEVKPIIGETIVILTETKGKMSIKLYVENETGWKNLLLINSAINCNNNGEFINIGELLICETDGITCVLSPEIDLDKYLDTFLNKFANIYYQLDFVEWGGQSRDEQWLLSIKKYITDYYPYLPALIIPDSYYLDRGDHEIKTSLNAIGKVGFKGASKDQFFKTPDDIFLQVSELFSETDERWEAMMENSIQNVIAFTESIKFKIPVGVFRLPEYELTESEKLIYTCQDDKFWDLIDKGLSKRITGKVQNEDVYLERLQEEIEVINQGGFINYFLILEDILSMCRETNIWYGIGRGSAAGSLVSYLLGIVGIDPLKYGLLFSRFLNKGRLGKSLPDIDLDFQGERRDEVKRYIETKYGKDYVTAIGTYGTLKVRSALKDLCRERGVDYTKTNYVVGMVDSKNKGHETSLTGLFKLAAEKPELKTFLQNNYAVIEKLPLCLSQPKNASIHASGIVIVPKQFGTVYQQMPIKKIDNTLVSEWEGEWIEKAGYLKCDILGIKQLDKISRIAQLIYEKYNISVTFDDIELDIPEVMQLFQDGYTEDVFQFGTPGLKAYCKELKPDTVNDLIAAVSLYRPGPMDSGMHKKYVKVKNGSEQVEYEPGTERITNETYGQIVYQEQIMQICSHMAGFDLVEADDIRKVLGKKLVEEVGSYKVKFVTGCLDRGYDKERVEALWDKMAAFAMYSFNKSHAAAYAITGYFCQWFKFSYPLQFWTVSMQYAEEEDIINRISEISKISDIVVAPVDINKSTKAFFADNASNTIFWSINSVKWVGDKAVEEILAERARGGEFYSIEDFCNRAAARSINKRTIVNLILAGAFDKVEKINPSERGKIINKYFKFTLQEQSEELLQTAHWRDYQWILKQKELTGFGFIDYVKIIRSSKIFAPLQKKFKENVGVLFSDPEDEEEVVVSGILQNVIERKSKKGPFGQLELVDNTDTLYITLWNETYAPVKKLLEESKNKIIILSGKITFDNYKQANVIHSKNSTKIEVI